MALHCLQHMTSELIFFIHLFVVFFFSQTIYESYFLTLYNTTFTSLPILLFGLYEQHMKQSILFNKPECYL